MYHLCTRISLLEVVGHSHRVELTHRVITSKYAAWILPGYSRACLHLSPRQAGVLFTQASLCNKVIDATLTLFVTRVPILHGRVLNLGIALNDNLYNGSVKLVFIALRSGTTLKVAHISPLVGNNKGTLKLTCTFGIDAEVG